jgi:hypothetical protein
MLPDYIKKTGSDIKNRHFFVINRQQNVVYKGNKEATDKKRVIFLNLIIITV